MAAERSVETQDACDPGEWGIYRRDCSGCDKDVLIVALVEHGDIGFGEAFADPLYCGVCRALRSFSRN